LTNELELKDKALSGAKSDLKDTKTEISKIDDKFKDHVPRQQYDTLLKERDALTKDLKVIQEPKTRLQTT